jgi:hypothetical protein
MKENNVMCNCHYEEAVNTTAQRYLMYRCESHVKRLSVFCAMDEAINSMLWVVAYGTTDEQVLLFDRPCKPSEQRRAVASMKQFEILKEMNQC